MRFTKRHYRAQVDARDCGVAALAMIYGYYGSYYSLASLREMAKTTLRGTTAFGLVKVSEELGFETRALKADMSLFDMKGVIYPFIAHVIKDKKLLHYYVVTGHDKHSVHIADPDPAVKMTKLSKEQIAQKWPLVFCAHLDETKRLDCQYRYRNSIGYDHQYRGLLLYAGDY